MAVYLTLPNVFMIEEGAPDKLQEEDGGQGCGGPCIEYLDREGLHEFLFRRRKDCGILQRFVEPKVKDASRFLFLAPSG